MLNRVDAKDLDLWKVCRPLDDPASKNLQAGPPLRVNKKLSSLWDGDPSDDGLHAHPGESAEYVLRILVSDLH